MQHWKFAAFGLAVGAMLVFLPLAGKLGQANDQEIKLSILMDVTCTMPQEELTAKLEQVESPADIGRFEQGQNKRLWDKAKQDLIAECYD